MFVAMRNQWKNLAYRLKFWIRNAKKFVNDLKMVKISRLEF